MGDRCGNALEQDWQADLPQAHQRAVQRLAAVPGLEADSGQEIIAQRKPHPATAPESSGKRGGTTEREHLWN
jgi:hypothetical protein